MKLFLALLVAVVGISNAQAADLPRTFAKAPIAAPAPSWTGLYLGGTLGNAWSIVDPTFSDPGNVAFPNCGPCFGPGFTTTTIDQKRSGAIAALHAGYNLQFSPHMLVGIEGDFTGTDLKHTTDVPLANLDGGGVPIVLAGSNLRFQTDINWMASLRGRAGYVAGNWMFYGTGGVAFMDYSFDGSAACQTSGCNPIFANASLKKIRTGWTAGAGAEWEFQSGWRARAEYLYYEFNSTDTTSGQFVNDAGFALGCGNSPTCSAVFSVGKIDIQTLRVGLSYAFR